MAVQIKTYKILFLFFLLLFTLFCKTSFSQTNFPYRKISVSFTNIPLDKALDQISNAGGFTFSYNSKNFNENELVSLDIKNKTVAKSLDKLFNNTVHYKVVGSHVILSKKNPQEIINTENGSKDYIMTGYIINSRTGEKIHEATIYEVDGRIVSLSDSAGFYSLTIPSDKEINGISFSKQGFVDTVIMVTPASKSNFNIYLKPAEISLEKIEPHAVNIKMNDLHNRQIVTLLVPEESRIISDNLIIHDNRKVQVSLIPFIGTNRKLSGTTTNSFSFNVLAGYSGGVNGFEIGGLLNIDRRNVRGAQIGGIANIVGGNTGPFQMAGFFNLNSGSITGTQVAGFSNVVLDTLNGVQLAGFNNTLHGYMNGVQISGFNNTTTQNVDGFQLTGFANVALKNVELGQISGFANYCNDVNGGQITGFVNFAKGDVNWGQIAGFANYGKSVKGLQIAGFGNISVNEVSGGQIAGTINYGKTGGKFQISGYANIATEEIKGIQLTSYLNYAKKVNGWQIAVFNVSDTVESGLPIGVFSFVKKGFHRFDISVNEIFYLNTSYKLGVKKLYNAIRLGYDFSDYAYAGYGMGTQFRISNKWNFHLDLSSDFIFTTDNFDYSGNLTKLVPTIDYFLGKHISFFVGPSLNISSLFSDSSNSFPSLTRYSFYSSENTNVKTEMWIGGTAGLSFTF